jgi:hypothetical protein
MYFKDLAQKLGEIPKYAVEYTLLHANEVYTKSTASTRKLFGDHTKMISMATSSEGFKKRLAFVEQYVLCQQYDVLKDKISYERVAIVPDVLSDSSTLPNHYINRIGEAIVVPIRGTCTISSEEFQHTHTMKAGEIWRWNNRLPMTYKFSSDFFAIIVTYIDFDLVVHLMPFDIYGIFPRRRDEWADYDPVMENKAEVAVDTNAY